MHKLKLPVDQRMWLWQIIPEGNSSCCADVGIEIHYFIKSWFKSNFPVKDSIFTHFSHLDGCANFFVLNIFLFLYYFLPYRSTLKTEYFRPHLTVPFFPPTNIVFSVSRTIYLSYISVYISDQVRRTPPLDISLSKLDFDKKNWQGWHSLLTLDSIFLVKIQVLGVNCGDRRYELACAASELNFGCGAG